MLTIEQAKNQKWYENWKMIRQMSDQELKTFAESFGHTWPCTNGHVALVCALNEHIDPEAAQRRREWFR